jgi:hypothetical protein
VVFNFFFAKKPPPPPPPPPPTGAEMVCFYLVGWEEFGLIYLISKFGWLKYLLTLFEFLSFI